MNFDEPIDRRRSHCVKWDGMEALYGVSPGDGLAMWVADMDFRPPISVQRALEAMTAHGVYGYFGDDSAYLEAIRWWMQTRHGWDVPRSAIMTTHGLVNGTALCIEAYTQPGDGIVVTSPVYHAFARIIRASGRQLVECRLAEEGGRYVPDFRAWDGQMTGGERMLILCSPHNPGGRVWTEAELRGYADFARRHNLILVSDEIHHDLVYPGNRHRVLATLVPEIADRLVTMTATTKTFNLAGGHTGNVIIPDERLRAPFAQRLLALGISPNSFGLHMATAAYTPEGAAWLEELMHYLEGNRRIFDAGVAEIPGVRSMPLEATYLSWVDFGGTGMTQGEITDRVERGARIAANHGPTFGAGGDGFLRFNIATQRVRVTEAVDRLKKAFADLQ